MKENDPTSPYLSPKVHQLYQVLSKEPNNDDLEAVSAAAIEEVCLVPQSTASIDLSVAYEKRDFEWYRTALEALVPLFHWCGKQPNSAITNPPAWMSHRGVVQDAYVAYERLGIDVRECLLVILPVVERSLRGLFSTLSPDQPVPPLLRDLVIAPQITELLGSDLSLLYMVLFGSPRSLNVRNCLWHGFFPCGSGVPLKLLATLSFMLQWTSRRLEEKCVIVRHPGLLLLQQPCVEPSVQIERLSYPISGWKRGLEHHRQGRSLTAMCVLVTEIEHNLRLMFVKANQCPERLLTAEHDSFYTTFTEMFEPHLPDGSTNELIRTLGVAMTEFFLDVFVLPEGPRLRDRLSHGEYEVREDLSEAAQWIHPLLTFLGALHELQTNVPKVCLESVHCHKPVYHPSTFVLIKLKQNVTLIEQTRDVYHTVCANQDILNTLDLSELPLVEETRSELTSELQRLLDIPSDSSSSSFVEELLCCLKKFRAETLFRPKEEYELLTSLRKVSAETGHFLATLYELISTRLEDLEAKRLSQRQTASLRKGFLILAGLLQTCFQTVCAISCAFASFYSERRLSYECVSYKQWKTLWQLYEKMQSYAKRTKWDETASCAGDADALVDAVVTALLEKKQLVVEPQ